jgi:thiosulfate/3-mercaptopyruvate sulfurtransferase
MTAPSPLISVDELASMIDDPHLRVVDVRWYLGQPGAGRAAYDAGHLPGAVHLDIDTELTDPPGPRGRHPLPDAATFSARLAAAGIGDGDLVVAYDDVGGWVAARLWWMLDDLGHERVAVLDGGIAAWIAAGLPLTTDAPSWPPATLRVRDHWTRTIDREALRSRLGSVTLLDARGAPRYRGEVEPIDKVPGHIPTAVNMPTDRNLGDDGRFLAPVELAERYRALGADRPAGEVVTSCGSGVSACVTALAMRVAGVPDPILYAGSYSEWTYHDLPTVTGDAPGDPA